MSPSFPNTDTSNSWCCRWASALDFRRALKLSRHSPWIYVWILAVTSSQGLRAPCHCRWAFSSSFWSFFLLLSIFSSFLCNLTIAFSSGGWPFLWFLATILISSRQNIVGIITATILFVGFRFLDKSRIYFVWWSHEFVYVFIVFERFPFPSRAIVVVTYTFLFIHFSFNCTSDFSESTPLSKHILWNSFKVSSHMLFLPWLLFVDFSLS